MMADKNEEIRRKVMKGVNDPKKHNAEHRANEKRDAKKAKEVQAALDKRKGKHTRRRDDGDGVVDTGMFR
jgi:tryptophanyl-tRNA synthetase